MEAIEPKNKLDLIRRNGDELQWQPLSSYDVGKVFISSNQLV